MPELPEVETVRIGLQALLPGRQIKAVVNDWSGSKPGEYISYSSGSKSGKIADFARQRTKSTPSHKNQQSSQIDSQLVTKNIHPAYSKSFPNAEEDVKQFLIGAKIVEVKRRAKVLLIELDSKYSLVIHLKMTGQLVYIRTQESPVPSPQSPDKTDDRKQMTENTASKEVERFGAGHPGKSLVGELPDKSTRVTLEFTDGSRLFFNDQRKFGWMKLMPTVEVPNIDFMLRVGPEPLTADFTWQEFYGRFKRRANSSIKAAILDQTVVAGVGNIYADESLWGAKIHPATLVKNISNAQFKALFLSLRDILQLAIDKGGSSDRNYVNAEGRKGSYLSFASVFRKQGQPCPRCGTTIIKLRVAGRGTHVCPNCQKLKI